jgi:hypothetical protein
MVTKLFFGLQKKLFFKLSEFSQAYVVLIG